MNALRVVICALTFLGVSGGAAILDAQTRAATNASMRVASSLDNWIVDRFRGAQLLEDTDTISHSIATDATIARIESVHPGGRTDTLFALHFSSRRSSAALERIAPVRLAAPTGTVAPIAVRLLARRPFRAPRAPKANSANENDWRYGWAYLVALPKAGRSTPAATFRGWLLLDASAPK